MTDTRRWAIVRQDQSRGYRGPQVWSSGYPTRASAQQAARKLNQTAAAVRFVVRPETYAEQVQRIALEAAESA
jgi:hypothetical protein